MAKNKILNKLTTNAAGYEYPGYLLHRISLAVGTLVTAVLGATMRGDWILILVHLNKQFGWELESYLPDSSADPPPLPAGNQTLGPPPDSTPPGFSSYLKNFHWIFTISTIISFVTYFSLAGYLQYYYYVCRKDQASEWKCQPERWLTPENERHEIFLGSFNMLLGGTYSSLVVTYIMNRGPYHTVYFHPLEKGWVYLVVSTIILFLYHDAMAYYVHRFNHLPLIYKNIHKHHHRYHSPTAFSAVAMHPVEFTMFQSIIVSAVFFLPIYSGIYIFIVLYQYYYGMIDHSGIKMDALWPWQPSSMFHDNHHKYFHTNFGFNLKFWDWFHDTLHQSDRLYGEDIFYGRGKQSNKVS